MQVTVMPRDERTQPSRIVPGYPQTPRRNPAEPLVRRAPTLSALTGPAEVAKRVQLLGGTVVEVWQANAAGRYRFDLKLRGEHETPFFDD